MGFLLFVLLKDSYFRRGGGTENPTFSAFRMVLPNKSFLKPIDREALINSEAEMLSLLRTWTEQLK